MKNMLILAAVLVGGYLVWKSMQDEETDSGTPKLQKAPGSVFKKQFLLEKFSEPEEEQPEM